MDLHKSDVFATFKKWKAEVENQINLKIKCLRSDNGGEILADQDKIVTMFCLLHNKESFCTILSWFKAFCVAEGIRLTGQFQVNQDKIVLLKG